MNKEQLTNGFSLWVDEGCTFGTDAVLLSAFAGVKRTDRVCDLGTGCGILPFLWQTANGGPTVDAVECEPHACELTRRSVCENGLQDRIYVWEQSWNALTLPHGVYDRVTCNPPYFSENSGKQSPDAARRLARTERGDTLTEVTVVAAKLLKNGGRFALCHRPERLVDVVTALRAAGLEPKRLQWVHHRVDSAPFLLLCEAIKGGGPSLTVLPPIIIKE
ncbi:MAG: methyltransferase [Clostridia bacterium]|nr:methyltransferase [Clostridia bacterium]